MTFENYEKNSRFQGTAVCQTLLTLRVFVTEHWSLYCVNDHDQFYKLYSLYFVALRSNKKFY